tara:strand:+ start:12999 stop:14330 length:1332 start_codon:yes stop_codon:yes gene_type:complete
MTLRLILVRHGLSTFNKDFRIQGRNDMATLAHEGHLQANETGKFLAKLPLETVYSSPLQRASQTTYEILKQRDQHLEPVFTDDLLEIDLEPWSGLTKDEVALKFPEAQMTWQKDPKNLVLKRKDKSEYNPVLETISQADIFIKKLIDVHSIKSNQNILIVGHNAILRCILINLLGDPLHAFRKLQLDNASISIINIKSKRTNPYEVQLECLNNTTHLNKSIPLKKENSRLILVRHGETNWNLEGRFQGQIDIPLNSNGKDQASATGSFLKNVQIDKAFSSSMTRPKETAELILKYHPEVRLELQEKLVEISHGLWEGKLESEIKEQWPDLLKQWHCSPQTVEMPGGETIQQVWSRSNKCWENICKSLKPEETALIVAHDAVNKTILCQLLGLNESKIWTVKQSNGGITIIDISHKANTPHVVTCLNLTSHLGGVIDNTATGAL